jgi:hypothetical protein
MSWRVVAAGAHAATKPNGSIVPLCSTKTVAYFVQDFLAEFKVFHIALKN